MQPTAGVIVGESPGAVTLPPGWTRQSDTMFAAVTRGGMPVRVERFRYPDGSESLTPWRIRYSRTLLEFHFPTAVDAMRAFDIVVSPDGGPR
jgi:hypothetical protein